MTTLVVWPREGASVPVPLPESPALSVMGATVTLTDYISNLLCKGELLTRDPLDDGTTPPATALPTRNSGAAWVNVRDYGARGDGATNDLEALRLAAAAVPDDGGVLYLPAGDYRISGFSDRFIPKDNTTVLGDGPNTVLSRLVEDTAPIVDATGTSNVRVSGIRFEHPTINNFMTSIDVTESVDCTVENCEFSCTAPDVQFPPPLGTATGLPIRTLHGVLGRDTSNLRVSGCRFYRMQCKATGTSFGRGAIVTGNFFYQPYDFAVSFVTGLESDPSLTDIKDIIVSNNIVEDPRSSGAFHIGGDGATNPVGTYRNVIVEGNIVKGSWVSGVGNIMLTMNLGIVSRNITVRGNVFHNEAGSYTNSLGVKMNAPDIGGTFDGLSVTDNHVYGCDQAAIQVSGTGKNVVIANNKVGRSRGIYVTATGAAGITGIVIEGNVADGCTEAGIQLDAATGSITSAVIAKNVCTDQRGLFESGYGIRLTAASGKTLEALVDGNRCNAVLISSLGQAYGIRQEGAGTHQSSFVNNDCRGNYIGGFLMSSGSAIGSGNRGSGFPSAAPTTGTWSVGDRVQNHNPVVGQPKGWVCTVAGTPGTWVSEGNL